MGVRGFSSARGFQFREGVVNPQENGIIKKKDWSELREETEGISLYGNVFWLLIGVISLCMAVRSYQNIGGLDGIMSEGVNLDLLSGLILFAVISMVCFCFIFRNLIKKFKKKTIDQLNKIGIKRGNSDEEKSLFDVRNCGSTTLWMWKTK